MRERLTAFRTSSASGETASSVGVAATTRGPAVSANLKESGKR
jgi:hypothetical protein